MHTRLKPFSSVCNAAVRSGDYYLFEDLGEKIELDLMTAKTPTVVHDVQLRQRLASKQTVEQVRNCDRFIHSFAMRALFTAFNMLRVIIMLQELIQMTNNKQNAATQQSYAKNSHQSNTA